jgi:predicted metal-dependent phosphoesterase TrpH
MPARSPFTYLCQTLARGPKAGRADLHLHTTASDGTYRPEEVVDLARRCGLSAIAITDHDTLAGVAAARKAAPASLEVIAGVEITAEHLGREVHLLGYFVDDSAALDAALADVRASRATRYREMIERLRALGVSIEDETLTVVPDAIGRRHLAEMLVRQGKAGSIREAFQRWLGDHAPAAVAKRRIPVGEAIRLVRGAGGVASWAHPSYDGAKQHLADLAALGLGAVEAEYPDLRRSQADQVRAWAKALGLAITGGSDCHGPGPRGVGACTISDAELDELRNHARRGDNPSGGV